MTSATALMALLAAWNGSPDAQALWDYVEANPAADELHALHAVGFVDQMLDHLPAQPARFAYSIAGDRTVIDLGAGESFELTVDATQRSTLSFESLRGSTALTATWQEPARRRSLRARSRRACRADGAAFRAHRRR